MSGQKNSTAEDTDYIPKNGGMIKLPLFRMGGTAIAVLSLCAAWNYFVPSKNVVDTTVSTVADLNKRVSEDHDAITGMKQEIDDMHRWMQNGNKQ